MTIRRGLLLFAVGLIALGVLLLLNGHGLAGPLVWGVILLTALLIERWRYVTPPLPAQGWIATTEKFIDPETGSVMQVQYHAGTGARRYVPIAPPAPSVAESD